MGIHDSSKTRVEPLFKRLLELDPQGGWLARLLELPTRDGVTPATWPDPGQFREGTFEKRLAPPRSLLAHLVETLRLTDVAETEPELRRNLLAGDAQALKRARELLQGDSPDRWHIFEGETSADVFLAQTA